MRLRSLLVVMTVLCAAVLWFGPERAPAPARQVAVPGEAGLAPATDGKTFAATEAATGASAGQSASANQAASTGDADDEADEAAAPKGDWTDSEFLVKADAINKKQLSDRQVFLREKLHLSGAELAEYQRVLDTFDASVEKMTHAHKEGDTRDIFAERRQLTEERESALQRLFSPDRYAQYEAFLQKQRLDASAELGLD
jgi:hypothetical protein